MKSSPEGLVPARGFLEAGMKPRPSFNDGSDLGELMLSLFRVIQACSAIDAMEHS